MCEEIMVTSEPNCLECLPPLLPENEDTAKVYQMAQNQLIMGPNGPVDVNIDAIELAMDHYMIQDRRRCRIMVMSTVRHMINRFYEQQKFKAASKKKK